MRMAQIESTKKLPDIHKEAVLREEVRIRKEVESKIQLKLSRKRFVEKS